MRLLLASALALALPARASVETLIPTADTFVSSAHANSNYGGGGTLSVSAGNLPAGEFDSLLRFNTAQAIANLNATFGAGNFTIQSITLQFSASVPNNGIFNGNGAGPGGTNTNLSGQFKLSWMQQDGWVEGTGKPNLPATDGVTYSTLPSFLSAADQPLGTFTFDGSNSGPKVLTLTLAGAFLADVLAGHDVSLLVQPQGSTLAYNFNSHDFMDSMVPHPEDNFPMLFITAIPEPSAAALLALAALAGAVWPRRPRHARVP